MNNTTTYILIGGAAVLGLGIFIYLSAQKTSAAIQQTADGTSNINKLAGTVNGLLNSVITPSQG